ncbi:hypothetical protein GH714_024453 [Hevea brasiliensis]|uniref:Uncharacterized protein n=1 Tax=Hevea brasiliensis TaxID=3981 RepID=A0A6A6M7S7_HEVBR|nr:hypothetical protein GH714_024453 [Hevea brasiliensis]
MIFEPILEDGVFRFDCSYPSLSFINTKDRDTPIISHPVPLYIPTFECVLGKQIVKLELPNGTSFYGTGEVSGPLERTGKRVFTWNTDSYGYGPETMPLYQSHPWVLAILPNGEALGVLADTTQRCEIDLRKESIIQFIASASYPVITFGPFASPTVVLKSLSHAIVFRNCFYASKVGLRLSTMPLEYDSDKRVREIAETFRKKGIPYDVIWMDIDYMDGFRCFTFDQAWEVWPGPCVFPDFTQSKVRSWWASLVKDFLPNGVDGIWNDMNEPAVFKVAPKTMPESNIHQGDDELGGCQEHSYYHNVFGMLMARSTFEGMKLANENKRPFVLTRAGFIGSQKDSVVNHFQELILADLLEMQCLSFLEGGWVSVQCFLFRGHSEKDSFDHEPWSFGDECEEVCRRALKRRYRLIPHLYTLFYDAHIMGTPVMTPTFFADPTNPSLRTIENSFLLGPLLVYASTIPDQGTNESQHELPKGIWLRFDFDDSHPDLPTLYLQGGSIIPLGPPHQHVGEANFSDDLTLVVALDEKGQAKGYYLKMMVMDMNSPKVDICLHIMLLNVDIQLLLVEFRKQKGLGRGPKDCKCYYCLVKVQWMNQFSTVNAVKIESSKHIPDVEEVSGSKGAELSRITIELKCGDWIVKIVPWIGGRIISMGHLPSELRLMDMKNIVALSTRQQDATKNTRSLIFPSSFEIVILLPLRRRDFEHVGEN